MARKYTSGMLTSWLREIAARLPDDVLRPLAKFASTRIGARATDTFMREGKGERGTNRTPLLRRVTVRLARSLVDARRKEAVNGAEIRGSQMTVTKGTAVPYAAANEHGYSGTQRVPAHARQGHPVRAHTRQMTIPARPFLRPAAEAEHDSIAKRGQSLITKLFRAVVRGGAAPAVAVILILFFPPAPQRAVHPQPVFVSSSARVTSEFTGPRGAGTGVRVAVQHMRSKRCAMVCPLGGAGIDSGGAA